MWVLEVLGIGLVVGWWFVGEGRLLMVEVMGLE